MHLFNVHTCYCSLFLPNKGGVNVIKAKEIISNTIWSEKWIAPRNILAVLILLFAFSMTYIAQLYTETSPQRLKNRYVTCLMKLCW